MLELYKSIFSLTAKDFVLEGVKLIGGGETRTGEHSYEFLAILSAPAPIEEYHPLRSDMVSLSNWARRALKGLAGPDLVVPVKWEVMSKGKKKKKSFNFAGNLNPMTVFEFEISEGRFFIKAEMYGLFY